MGSIYPGCEDSVHNLNPQAKVCSEQHCDNFTESQTFHDNCNQYGQGHPLYPISTAQCVNRQTGQITEPTYDPTWGYTCPDGYGTQICYCCCSCLANGTPIAIPDGVKAIEQFVIGDDITVGDWTAAKLSWKKGSVAFSSGSDAGWPSTMMFIEYGENKKLITSVDHLFLLANGKLKRADRVVPHKDQLMSAEGTSLDILSSMSGKWTKGLHHVATDLHFTGSLDGHLINSAGVVSGDYCLQINQHELIKRGLMDGPDTSPALGSSEFSTSNPHLDVTRASAVKRGTDLVTVAAPAGFTAFNPNGGTYIPPGAAQFLTNAQATDIVNNAKARFRDLHSDSGFDAVNYLLKVFKAFYPDIHILVDQANPNFNTYAFEMYGQKYLVISGEIMRLDGLYADGYKFIIAQGIARLLGNTPKDKYGFTYAAAADFYATSSIFREVFYLDSDDLPNNALDQIKTVFGLISETNAAGDQNDLANNPSIKCRVGSISTGIIGGNVPLCACADLALLAVITDSSDPGQLRLELIFNKEIDSASVKDLYNFEFSCGATKAKLPQVLSAQVSSLAAATVVLMVESPMNVKFTVTVTDVLSTGGSVLGAQNSGSFNFVSPN
ncbi:MULTISPECIES: hypothetical protein [Burkholderiaceae]|uniref:hypothetical protein n=1 Tax=Burkholderiaceae TaxID=119060 RepID=UPI00095CA5BA|nr:MULTISPECIES: hypothetical protein [Burkholderiaceae]MCF2133791.1 hypothetical protein [Mycetohabitans sp. B3]MCG1038843.1 hypothetical protein [Mycetohabitans sp. B7]SIT68546.1 hypothetical protein SAMN04487769_1342 [Burkholderia sp. b14]